MQASNGKQQAALNTNQKPNSPSSRVKSAPLILCPNCDASQVIPFICSGRLRCWRCKGTLERATGRSLEVALICALTTLIFLFPANLLPLLRLSYAGIISETHAASGVASLWQEGWPLVAVIVALQVIILPFFRFGLLTLSLAAIHSGIDKSWIGPAFRWAEKLDPWAMPDVFLIGCAIGYSRIEPYAPVSIGASYRAVFTAAADSLSKNAPVELMGSVIGSISDAKLEYSPVTGKLSINAVIVIEPKRIELANGQGWTDQRRQMNSMMQRLVAQGLRAEISSSPPAIGGHIVALRIVPNTKGMIIPGELPQIPTASGSDIADTIQSASDFTNKLNELPVQQIANEIHQSTQHIASLVSSPALPRTLRRVDDSAANVDQITAEARSQLPAALGSARRSIAEAEATLASAQALVTANPAQSSQPESADVPQALYEVTRAARSLRELSDFLDRHPEALIEGRGFHQ